MRPIVQPIATAQTPESLVEHLRGEAGLVLLRSALFDSPQTRYSFLSARPFLTFRSFGSRCEITRHAPRITHAVQFGDPWHLLDTLMARFELLDEIDLPFPLGGCFGYWGYDLKNFVEPMLPRRAVNDLERTNRGEYTAVLHREPLGGVIGKRMPARLGFQQQREGRIAVDVDPLDRIHLHGDRKPHVPSPASATNPKFA